MINEHFIRKLLYFPFLIRTVSSYSREFGALRLHSAAKHGGKDARAGSEGRDE